jgi:CDP-diacylglycerol--glycerol-3-phosphate 3-phosphatidyltransferase
VVKRRDSTLRAAAREAISAYLEAPVVRLLSRLGVSPNGLTLAGLLVAGGSAYLLSQGFLAPGGALLLASGIFDLFDGALARATGRASKFGALLDSVADRVSEGGVLAGLLVFYLNRSDGAGAALVYLAFGGSMLVSYLRARAEGLGIECKVGVMTRPERVVALGAGLIVGWWWLPAVIITLGAIGGLTILTSAQRLLHVWRTDTGPEVD